MGVLTVVYQPQAFYLTFMNRYLGATICCLLLICGLPTTGQKYWKYPEPNSFYDDTLMHQRFWVEVDLDLDPIYSFQFSSRFRYGGHVLNNLKPLPRFYVVQPGTTPLSGVNEIADQSNAIYANIRLFGPNATDKPILNNLTFIVGITHDKLQTNDSLVQYHFPNGGMEFTFMLDKNVTFLLRDWDFKMVDLMCDFDLRAGFFISGSTIQTYIRMPDTVIQSVDFKGYVWQERNPYLGGMGWQVSGNFEVGGIPFHCGWGYHWAFTVGVRTLMEGLYTSPQVQLNNEAPRRLSIDNYGLFFVGPNVNIKYLIFRSCKKQS
jgi:hypothetical protein